MQSSRRKFLARFAGSALSVAGVLATGVWLGAGTQRSKAAQPLRPPGALPEEDFLATCIRCGRCVDACPNRCIVAFTEQSGKDLSTAPTAGERGTPVIFPRRQACILCNGAPGHELLCTAACPSGALKVVRKTPESILKQGRMGVAEVDENLCYSFNGASCGACVRACPFEGQALRAGLWEKPLLDETYCVGCGLCERACLTYPQAIQVTPKGAA